MPVKIERSNPYYKPGRYYPRFIDPEGSFPQSLLRKLYLSGHPQICLIGGSEKKHFQRERDREAGLANLKFHPRPGTEPVVKIRMLKTMDSSPNGIEVICYERDRVYEVGATQARRFLKASWAELIEGEKLPEPIEDYDAEKERAKLKEFMNAAAKKLKVKMLETHDSSPDAIHTFKFRGGQVYELPETLARNFIRSGWAEKAEKIEEKKNE